MKKRSAQPPASLSATEIRRLAEAVVGGNGGCIEETELDRQLTRVIEWGETNRIQAACLRLVLEGQLDLRADEDGEIEFRELGYSQGAESS